MNKLKILVACEESQAVCIEFRKLGHEAYSCDLIECSGGFPEWHIQYDALLIMNSYHFYTQDRCEHFVNKWDLIISFQPCTDLAVSGAAWFEKKRLNGSQEQSIRFFFDVWKLSNCSENPIGILNGGDYIKKWFPLLHKEMLEYGFPFKPTQIIQPYMFGHPESKATCLWLRGLPLLKGTNNVKDDYLSLPKNKAQRIHYLPPTLDRAKLRSKTYPGIALAMATQWGNF